MIRDESPEVRKRAAMGFWEFPESKYGRMLMEVAESDRDVDVRAAAISVLGAFIFEGAVTAQLPEDVFLGIKRFLLEIVGEEPRPMLLRRMALEALSFDTDDRIADLVQWAYENPDPDVRGSAILCMGRGSPERWRPSILAEVASENRQYKILAINAAGDSALWEATPKLRALAMSHDKEIRLCAIWALARTRGPGALELLEMCGTDEDEEVRTAAEDAIEEYHAFEEQEIEEFEERDDEFSGGAEY